MYVLDFTEYELGKRETKLFTKFEKKLRIK